MASAGYSGTPLAKKLSLKPGMRVWSDGMPPSIHAEIGFFDLIELSEPEADLDAALIFLTERSNVESKPVMLRPLLAPVGFIWVGWPKKASKVPTDVTGNAIRAVILPTTDLVDVKVCAVDAVWSGLKLVIRKSAR